MAIREVVVEGPRKGFKPRGDVGRLLLYRSTSTREAIVLTKDVNGDDTTLIGVGPTLLTDLSWKTDDGSEIPPTHPKLHVPWKNLTTPFR